MVMLLMVIPFIVCAGTAIVLSYAARDEREKRSIFVRTPPDIDSDNARLIMLIRISFWVSLSLSVIFIVVLAVSKIGV